MMKETEISRRRLLNQMLVRSAWRTPLEVADWMGAMQGQDFEMAQWAVGMRTRRPSRSEVAEAFARGDLLRIHLNRGTWHVVSKHYVRSFLSLHRSRNRSRWLSSMKAHGVSISDDEFGMANRVIARELNDGGCLTRDDFKNVFRRIGYNELYTHYFVAMAEIEGLICSGELPSSYALLDARVPEGACRSHEENMALLAQTYFQSHAPATLSDFVMWSGLPQNECRRAILSLGSAIESEGDYFLSVNNAKGRFSNSLCRLLPAFDEILIGYKNRGAVVKPEHEPMCYNANHGMFYPVVLCAHQIVGNWKRRVFEPTYFPEMQPTQEQETLAIRQYQDYWNR